MEQKKIMELLKEAADENCVKERRDEIREEFTKAAREVSYPIGTPSEELIDSLSVNRHQILPVIQEAYEMVVWDMFQETVLWHDPSYLPKLFPVFAAICGDRPKLGVGGDVPDAMFAVIDWEKLTQSS